MKGDFSYGKEQSLVQEMKAINKREGVSNPVNGISTPSLKNQILSTYLNDQVYNLSVPGILVKVGV